MQLGGTKWLTVLAHLLIGGLRSGRRSLMVRGSSLGRSLTWGFRYARCTDSFTVQ